MSQINRYLLSELLKVFLITLVGLTMFMCLVVLGQHAIKEGLGVAPVLRMVPYAIPNALRFAVPGTLLFAACSVYGRITANNEVLAVKSMGISPVVLLRPAIGLTLVVSLCAVWINDVAVSWGTTGLQRVVLQSIEEIAYGMLSTHKTYSPTDQLTISVQHVEGRRLIRPAISIRAGKSGGGSLTVMADAAEMRYDPEQDALSVFLTNSEIYGDFGEEEIHALFPTWRRQIPLKLAPKDKRGAVRPSDCPTASIPLELRHQRAVIADLQRALAAEAAFALMSGDLQQLDQQPWRDHRQELRHAKTRLFKLQVEPWRRWANAFSGFFFVLAGAPLAMQLKNSDLFSTFFICFLPILIVYYPLLMFGVNWAKVGKLPPYSVWLGNLILLLIASYLIRCVARR